MIYSYECHQTLYMNSKRLFLRPCWHLKQMFMRGSSLVHGTTWHRVMSVEPHFCPPDWTQLQHTVHICEWYNHISGNWLCVCRWSELVSLYMNRSYSFQKRPVHIYNDFLLRPFWHAVKCHMSDIIVWVLRTHSQLPFGWSCEWQPWLTIVSHGRLFVWKKTYSVHLLTLCQQVN